MSSTGIRPMEDTSILQLSGMHQQIIMSKHHSLLGLFCYEMTFRLVRSGFTCRNSDVPGKQGNFTRTFLNFPNPLKGTTRPTWAMQKHDRRDRYQSEPVLSRREPRSPGKNREGRSCGIAVLAGDQDGTLVLPPA